MQAYPGLTIEAIGDLTDEQIDMLLEDDGEKVDPRTGRPVIEFRTQAEAQAFMARARR